MSASLVDRDKNSDPSSLLNPQSSMNSIPSLNLPTLSWNKRFVRRILLYFSSSGFFAAFLTIMRSVSNALLVILGSSSYNKNKQDSICCLVSCFWIILLVENVFLLCGFVLRILSIHSFPLLSRLGLATTIRSSVIVMTLRKNYHILHSFQVTKQWSKKLCTLGSNGATGVDVEAESVSVGNPSLRFLSSYR